MKFRKSPTKGNLLVELEPGNTRLINNLNGPITELKTMLVPIDFSDCSKHALKYAVAFAKQFNAEITLLAVVQDTHTSFEYGVAEFVDLQDQRRKRYEQELTKLADQQLGKIKHQILVTTGKPFEEIVRTAQESDQDLIVISTHGHRGLTRVEIGSTAERVIRYATCPVLVVRPREREFVPPA
jgi:nucleotide-binding universal stress UspA family protein